MVESELCQKIKFLFTEHFSTNCTQLHQLFFSNTVSTLLLHIQFCSHLSLEHVHHLKRQQRCAHYAASGYFFFCRSFNIFSYLSAASVIFFFGLAAALLSFAFVVGFFLVAVLAAVFSGAVLIGLFPNTLFLSGALLVMTRCLSALRARDWFTFNVCKCRVLGLANSLAAKCGLHRHH